MPRPARSLNAAVSSSLTVGKGIIDRASVERHSTVDGDDQRCGEFVEAIADAVRGDQVCCAASRRHGQHSGCPLVGRRAGQVRGRVGRPHDVVVVGELFHGRTDDYHWRCREHTGRGDRIIEPPAAIADQLVGEHGAVVVGDVRVLPLARDIADRAHGTRADDARVIADR